MKRRMTLLIAPALVLAGALLAFADQPGGPPGKSDSQPAAEPARGPETMPSSGRLEGFIQAIRDADYPSQAISAYARGCAVDRTQPEIHEAYMRRMLQFGLPRIAQYGARALVAMQDDNGMAWGVLGYMAGRKGDLADALSSMIRAAEGAPDNVGILHNSGQLFAWYENDPEVPVLSDRTKRAMSRLREQLAEREPFAKAYREIVSAYKDQNNQSKALAEKIDVAQAEAVALEQLALEVDRKIRDLNDEIAYRDDVIDSLQRDLYRPSWGGYRDSSGRYWYYPLPDAPYASETRRRIREEERTIDRLQLEVRVLRREGLGVLRDLSDKRAQVDGLREQMKAALERVQRRFRWDPPAVDGVVTDEVEHFPLGPPPPAASQEPETLAQKRLEMAQLYLRHNLRDRAVEILQQLVKDYGDTKAAADARLLLQKLGPLK